MPSSDFDEVRASFRALLGENHRAHQRKALRKVGKLVKDAMKARAPVRSGEYSRGGALKPGELAASIQEHVHVPTDEQILAGKPSGVVVAPSGNLYGLALAIEYGHAIVHGGRTGKGGTVHSARVPAHPFIRPAADATREEAEATYEASMVEDIQKAMQ